MDPFSEATRLERRIVQRASEQRIPLGGAFELLPLCNMNCRMCFLRLSPDEMAAQGRLRTADEWLSLAGEAQKAGLLFLLLTGGEPFLFPDFAYLYRELCQMGLIITINTNGTLLTEEIADALALHKPRRVNVTLYGSSDEVYSRLCGNPHGYTQALRAIHMLKERGIAVKLNCSLTRENYDDFPKLRSVAQSLALPLMPDSYMFPSARKGCMPFDHSSRITPAEAAKAWTEIKRDELDEEAFSALCRTMAAYADTPDRDDITEPEKIPCRAGVSSFWINWKGNMTPCVFMEHTSIPVFEEGFDASWAYIRAQRDLMFMPPKCTSCGKRACCSVCAAAVLTETGALTSPPPYVCEMTAEKIRCMQCEMK